LNTKPPERTISYPPRTREKPVHRRQKAQKTVEDLSTENTKNIHSTQHGEHSTEDTQKTQKSTENAEDPPEKQLCGRLLERKRGESL
jgi:Mg-chelatase subunit ChlI